MDTPTLILSTFVIKSILAYLKGFSFLRRAKIVRKYLEFTLSVNFMKRIGHKSYLKKVGKKEHFYLLLQKSQKAIRIKFKSCLDSLNKRKPVDAVRNSMFPAPF